MRKLRMVKQEMIKKDVSSLKLSQDLNINPCRFSLYLNGWKTVPESLKKEIAEYLKADKDELFEEHSVLSM